MDRRGDPCALRLHLPCRNQFQQRTKSPAASGGITSSSAVPSYAIVRRTSCLRRREEYRAALAASLPLPHFRAELTYQVTYNDGGLWSLYTQSRESGFSGRPTLLRHGDTWDLTSGYPVPLSAFFPRRSGMEAAADGGSGGGDPAAGDGWDLPVP